MTKNNREVCITSKLAPDGPASLISLSTASGVHGSGFSPTPATAASPGCRRALPATEADGAYDGMKSLAAAVGGDTAAAAAGFFDVVDRGDGPCEEGGVKTFVEAADEASFLEEEDADEAWGDGIVVA